MVLLVLRLILFCLLLLLLFLTEHIHCMTRNLLVLLPMLATHSFFWAFFSCLFWAIFCYFSRFKQVDSLYEEDFTCAVASAYHKRQRGHILSRDGLRGRNTKSNFELFGLSILLTLCCHLMRRLSYYQDRSL